MSADPAAVIDQKLRSSLSLAGRLSVGIVTVCVALLVLLVWWAITDLPDVGFAVPLMALPVFLLIPAIWTWGMSSPRSQVRQDGVFMPLRERRMNEVVLWTGIASGLLWLPVAISGTALGSDKAWAGVFVMPLFLLPLGIKLRDLPRGLLLQPSSVTLVGTTTEPVAAWSDVAPWPVQLDKHATRVSMMVRVDRQGKIIIPTLKSDLKMWELIEVLTYFRDHPEERPKLADPTEARQLIDEIRAYPIAADAPTSPAWFRPPPAESEDHE